MDSNLVLEPDLASKLLRLWREFLDRSDLTIDDDFFESGGDSLLAEELLIQVEQMIAMKVPPSLLFETGTARRLAERLGQNEQLQPRAAVSVGGKQGRLFHFFHGDFTHGGVSARRLAAMLGPDRPVLAIAPHGMNGEQLPASIEEMAADRMSAILEAQPHGPYVLGGHCVGALVAFECARILVNAGERVDMVAMIDPVVASLRPLARVILFVQELGKRTVGAPLESRRRSLELSWKLLVKYECRLRQLAQEFNQKRFWSFGVEEVALSREPKRKSFRTSNPEIMRRYANVLLDYRPSRLDVSVLYVALNHSGRGWRGKSSDIELINLPHVGHQLQGDAAAAVMGIIEDRLRVLDTQTTHDESV